ncbi:MAG: NAD(P)(+) transhydrogenase (Re/Si-specific) subunit beta [Nitrospinota bacterium]
MNPAIIKLGYLLAAVLFIIGIKGLGHPRTAVRGNFIGAVGMLIAIVLTLLDRNIVRFEIIVAGLVVGAAVGAALALKIQITAMPQMVALLNGFGGGASVVVAGASLIAVTFVTGAPKAQSQVAVVASGLIGAVTFWGSLVAFGKLAGKVTERSVQVPGHQFINIGLFLGSLALGAMILLNPSGASAFYWGMVLAASILGVFLTIPIGGADMPVAICLLNSYSGLAAASTGFVLANDALIITGSLVGASGLILTQIMCKAMNRSLVNVLTGGFEASDGEPTASDEIYEGRVKSTSADEIAMLFDDARRVVITPGYGMAVARAQHAIRDLATLLEERGVEVEYGIHPVAGRMPGHMNVLLAEAEVPYDKLKEMDEINPTFKQTDVVLVVGANDTVNPVANQDSSSPIAGMPILEVDQARAVVIIKRSLSPGFAGIPNPLFVADNALMFFSDAQKAALEIIAAIKET